MTAGDRRVGGGEPGPAPPGDVMLLHGRPVRSDDVERVVARSHPALRPSSGAAFSVTLDGDQVLVVVHEIDGRRCGEVGAILDAIRLAVVEHGGIRPYAIVLTRPGTSGGPARRDACRDAFLTDCLDRVAEWREAPPPADEERQAVTRSQAEIEAWLVTRIADMVGAPPALIDLDATLSHFGFDSAKAAGVAGQLEDWLGRRLSPTLLYNYPTVRGLAAHLSGAPDAPPPVEGEEAAEQAEALERLQALSEADLEQLLEARLRALAHEDAP